MRNKRCSSFAVCCGLLFLGSAVAAAQSPPESGAPAVAPTPFGTPVTVYAGTRAYVWTLYVPELTTERVAVAVSVPVLHVHGKRWDYDLPDLQSKRFKLGQVAEFNCKYSDWGLPEECLTQWRDVYADLPVLTMQHDHLNYDTAEWEWEEQTMHIDLPHWTWRESTLTVSVPTFAPKDAEQAQAGLDAQQAAAAKVIDQGIKTLDTGIAAIEAQGADPHHLTVGGTTVDLPAMRQTLRDEKASELERIAAIRGTLHALSVTAPDAGGTPLASGADQDNR
jgi:hypothetical protein